MRPTHIVEGDLLYSASTDFNINLTPKHPSSGHISQPSQGLSQIWPTIVCLPLEIERELERELEREFFLLRLKWWNFFFQKQWYSDSKVL